MEELFELLNKKNEEKEESILLKLKENLKFDSWSLKKPHNPFIYGRFWGFKKLRTTLFFYCIKNFFKIFIWNDFIVSSKAKNFM